MSDYLNDALTPAPRALTKALAKWLVTMAGVVLTLGTLLYGLPDGAGRSVSETTKISSRGRTARS